MKLPIMRLLLALPLFLTACSVHNKYNVQTRVSIKPLTTNQYPAQTERVFLTQMVWPKQLDGERLATIDVGTVTTQSPYNAMRLLAENARKLGANAVFDVKVWQQEAGFSWQAPQCSGTAIRLANTNSLTGFTGSWY
jgi:uncharacterized protein YbjQ (UPF0145 family)